MFKKKRKILLISLFLLIVLGTLSVVFSQACCTLNTGTTNNYWCYHGNFRRLVSFHGQNLFVPTGSSGEWSSFLNNAPSDVTPYTIECCSDSNCLSLTYSRCVSYSCVECVELLDCSHRCIDGGGQTRTYWTNMCMECWDNTCNNVLTSPDCSVYCTTDY
ncbi:hypothetical protein KO361_06250 [Candidatus Woesearchaeota archaeon]|nr:hypothetical protein [Candidatus Woesearchaeota archaeon]